jgi:hypothetical protein
MPSKGPAGLAGKKARKKKPRGEHETQKTPLLCEQQQDILEASPQSMAPDRARGIIEARSGALGARETSPSRTSRTSESSPGSTVIQEQDGSHEVLSTANIVDEASQVAYRRVRLDSQGSSSSRSVDMNTHGLYMHPDTSVSARSRGIQDNPTREMAVCSSPDSQSERVSQYMHDDAGESLDDDVATGASTCASELRAHRNNDTHDHSSTNATSHRLEMRQDCATEAEQLRHRHEQQEAHEITIQITDRYSSGDCENSPRHSSHVHQEQLRLRHEQAAHEITVVDSDTSRTHMHHHHHHHHHQAHSSTQYTRAPNSPGKSSSGKPPSKHLEALMYSSSGQKSKNMHTHAHQSGHSPTHHHHHPHQEQHHHTAGASLAQQRRRRSQSFDNVWHNNKRHVAFDNGNGVLIPFDNTARNGRRNSNGNGNGNGTSTNVVIPFSLIFLGFALAFILPQKYQYPRPGVPYMTMTSLGQEISGYPRVMGSVDGGITKLHVHAGVTAQVFDVKLYGSTMDMCMPSPTLGQRVAQPHEADSEKKAIKMRGSDSENKAIKMRGESDSENERITMRDSDSEKKAIKMEEVSESQNERIKMRGESDSENERIQIHDSDSGSKTIQIRDSDSENKMIKMRDSDSGSETIQVHDSDFSYIEYFLLSNIKKKQNLSGTPVSLWIEIRQELNVSMYQRAAARSKSDYISGKNYAPDTILAVNSDYGGNNDSGVILVRKDVEFDCDESMLERVLTFDLGDFDQFVPDVGGEFVCVCVCMYVYMCVNM